MVSYDVCSLFTNIPLTETIDLAVETIFANNQSISISKDELKDLFNFATKQTHFLFNGDVFDQIDGVAMGSPLAPILANLFMSNLEEKFLNSMEGNEVLFYKRYVDDIFCCFETEAQANNFLEYISQQHPNIKFTIEKEEQLTSISRYLYNFLK